MNKLYRRIKHTVITLGIASGMTAAALTYQHTPDNCRAMVLAEVGKNQQFVDAVAPVTFTEAMTRGR